MLNEWKKQMQAYFIFVHIFSAFSQCLVAVQCVILVWLVTAIPSTGRANQTMVGIDQNNTMIELVKGQVLLIELPGNVGSGLKWSLDELDDSFWLLIGDEKKVSENTSPDFVGNSYLHRWKFKAVKAGSSKIRLLYNSPWEDKNMAVERFEIKVVISP